MKKTLIALTLAALPVASMAEVTLYGNIKGGLEVTKVKGVSNTITNVNDWSSRIGFKGEEDLGNGLKAIWQLEQKVSLDSKHSQNKQGWADRDSFIGLDAGTFGKVRAGYLSDAINDMGDLNLDGSDHGVRKLQLWERTGGRHTAVRYDSANFGGLSFNVLYSPEDNQRYDQARDAGVKDVAGFEKANGIANKLPGGKAGDEDITIPAVLNGATRNSWATSVGVNYAIAGFFVKYGYLHQNDKDSVYNSNVHRLMAGYDANNVFVGLGYQYAKGYDGPKHETNELALSAAYRLGNVVPRISYVHGFKEKGYREDGTRGKLANSKYHQVVLGADYNLSKRTTVIASLGWMKEGAGRQADYIGLVPDGTDAAGNAQYKKSEQAYSFGLGLSHKF